MKKLKYLFAIVTLACLTACSDSEDDGVPSQPTIVTTSDYTVEVSSNVMVGDIVGMVPGTSNKGSVTFAIASQTPAGAFSVGSTSGELIVADANIVQQSVNAKINLEVTVSKDDVSKTSAVVVDVLETMTCSTTDLTTWIGSLSLAIEDSTFPPVIGVGAGGDCGMLTITAIDFIGLACINETDVVMTLQPFSDGDTSGTVTLELQDYLCEPSGLVQIEGQGEYDIATETITLDYTIIFTSTDSLGPLTMTITPDDGNNGGSVDADGDGVLSDTDTDDNDPCLPVQDAGYTGYDGTNAIWSGADCDGDGTTNGDEVLASTDPYTSDTGGGDPVDADGDGVLSDTDTDDNDPCVPVQIAGYNGFDETNTIWSTADCDSDGIVNGDEVTAGTDPYTADGGSCESTVDTSIWEGDIEVEDVGFETSVVAGTAGCGQITLTGDYLGLLCTDGTPSLVIVFTPSSDGATEGTIAVASQTYDCFLGEEATFEGTGTYDETTGLIVIEYDFSTPDGGGFTGTLNITKQ